jgi:hypothetical protein
MQRKTFQRDIRPRLDATDTTVDIGGIVCRRRNYEQQKSRRSTGVTKKSWSKLTFEGHEHGRPLEDQEDWASC